MARNAGKRATSRIQAQRDMYGGYLGDLRIAANRYAISPRKIFRPKELNSNLLKNSTDLFESLCGYHVCVKGLALEPSECHDRNTGAFADICLG